jgi:hypothetical protein
MYKVLPLACVRTGGYIWFIFRIKEFIHPTSVSDESERSNSRDRDPQNGSQNKVVVFSMIPPRY